MYNIVYGLTIHNFMRILPAWSADLIGVFNMKKYRTEGHHLFEYSEKQGSYIHVYQNFRLTGQALINAYLADKIDYINGE